jgi:pyruvate dehydrogenase E2 component (dihydrolipoamide acetyltransferase)
MPKEFALPDLGEGIHEAQIIRVLVKPGDRVEEDQYLMEVETDKAAVEIPSPYKGIAKIIHVKEGQTVNVGDVIVTFDEAEDGRPEGAKPAMTAGVSATQSAAPAAPAAKAKAQPALGPAPQRTTAVAAPAVRKLARELGVDLDAIPGTGPGGRVTKEDVEAFAAKGGAPGVGAASAPAVAGSPAAFPSPAPPLRPPASGLQPGIAAPPALPPGVADRDKWGPIRRVPLTQIRKTIAAQMVRSAFTAPHVTHGDEADITELDRQRRNLNEASGGEPKLTVMSFLIRAVCIALRKYPVFNSSFDDQGGQILYKEYVNMGVAVDTERGLIVPVIRDADKLTLRGIAAALRTIADRIRTNQFAIEDLRGGTFTITNVGALGGTFSTPIINYPEVAILGLGRSRKVPVFRDGQLAEALMLPVSLSFDHRATDGANAARFTREIIGFLENPAKFILDS